MNQMLTAKDRCDACYVARAYVYAYRWDDVAMTRQSLAFCAHHAAKHLDALTLAGWDAYDERANLISSVKAAKKEGVS